MSEREITTLSLFSGGGGLDLGFSAAGYFLRGSVDIDFYSCKTLESNAGKEPYLSHSVIINEDLTKISASQLLKKVGLKRGQVDFIIGGPPCQAFSVFGRRKGIHDPRGNLIWEFLKVVKYIQPDGFLLENVPGLKSIHEGNVYEQLVKELSCDGTYTISEHSYELADYGVPQYRSRVFLVGCKGGKKIPLMLPSHGFLDKQPHVTAGKALSNMPLPGIGNTIPNHIGRNHSDRIIERYRNLKFGERDPKTRINKIHPDKPSFTIIVGSDAGGGKGHIHPFAPREVTPRESARLQTFPDWWEFYGKGRHVIRQVGNAVPPLFAAVFGQHISAHLFGRRDSSSYQDFVELLKLDFLR